MNDDLSLKRHAALEQGLRWSYAAQAQCDRVNDHNVALLAHHHDRHRRTHYGHEDRLHHIRLRVDLELLFVAGDQLVTAVDYALALGMTGPGVDPGMAARIGVLRDVTQHWNEHPDLDLVPEKDRRRAAGRAARLFAERFPGEDPTSYTFHTLAELGPITAVSAGGLLLEQVRVEAQHWMARFLTIEQNLRWMDGEDVTEAE